ncbi:flotillin-2-like [Paramacrobiotus metropolitanus]|uniref:flotillin-2-like n=1 Tax=Paramacrobiotus metropolitanus TaxID=2943436 RepID=UPI0024460560|nr:flotillin-2-like [Paramacrobiotus metropolitanus]
MGNIHTTGPNELLVVSGGCCGAERRTVIRESGWAWAWWWVSDVSRLTLEVMTLKPQCNAVETSQGVQLTVTGVAQVKVMTRSEELLGNAIVQFLGRSVEEIKEVILQTMEGHLRAILGSLTVEAIYQDRESFAAQVTEVAAPDVAKMGIEILSFTIKEIFDHVNYLSSLGRAQTAIVKRDANIGVAEAERDAGIQEAENERLALDVKFKASTNIENAGRLYQLQKAVFEQEVNTKKAESQLAYELQAAREKQKIRSEEINIEVVERRKQIEIEEKEILRREKELKTVVTLPADYEAKRVALIAEGDRNGRFRVAEAEAHRIRAIGGAEASTIHAKGQAEAEAMKMRAYAYKEYGNAATVSLILDALPKIAHEIAAPLAKTNEIVVLGGANGDLLTGLTKAIAQIPPAIHAINGIDLSQTLAKVPGAKVSPQPH